jgi:hypothetical protein
VKIGSSNQITHINYLDEHAVLKRFVYKHQDDKHGIELMQANHRKYVEQVEHVDSFFLFKGSDLKFIKTHGSGRLGKLETQTDRVDEDGPERATSWFGRTLGLDKPLWAWLWLPFRIRAGAAWCALFVGVGASCQRWRVRGSPPHLFFTCFYSKK